MATSQFSTNVPDDVDQSTYQFTFKQFQSWVATDANPAYQRLVKAEQNIASLQKLTEKVDVLNGTRNQQSLPQGAVRYQDMRFIADLPSIPTAKKAAGATVTADEYNRLVDDMRTLYAAIGSLASLIHQKIG